MLVPQKNPVHTGTRLVIDLEVVGLLVATEKVIPLFVDHQFLPIATQIMAYMVRKRCFVELLLT
jgi:hypothetical protein